MFNFTSFCPGPGCSPGTYPSIPRIARRFEGSRFVAGVSSFGFGGTNHHVIVGEPDVPAAPFPIDALAPSMGATAFASAMSFHGGGEIPGYGDVPIMAQGGETVVTRQLTEQVRNNRGGGGGGGHTIHISFGDVQALDAAGVDGVLKKHAALIQKHVTAQLRRMNK